MRSLLSRLALVAGVGIAILAGCGTQSSTPLPSGGLGNGTGGGGTFQSTPPPAPAGFAPTLILDNGSTTIGTYVGFNIGASDSQSPTNFEPTPVPTSDPGSHLVSLPGTNATQFIIKYRLTAPTSSAPNGIPSLVYTFGVQGNTYQYTYGSITLTMEYFPSPQLGPDGLPIIGAPASVAIELVGNAGTGTGTSTYDVRRACTLGTGQAFINPVNGDPEIVNLTCPLLAWGTGNNNAGQTGAANPIAGSATGLFTPAVVNATTGPTLYIVFNYAIVKPGFSSATASALIDDVEAHQ